MPFRNRNHRNFKRTNSLRTTVFSDLIVGEKVDSISSQFHYNIASDEVITETTGSGNVVQENSMAILSTGEQEISKADLRTVDSVRYRPGHEGFAQFTARFTAEDNKGIEGCDQLIGIFNDDNGYFIGFKGETFVVGRRFDGEDFITERENFNIDKLDGGSESIFNFIPSELNVFRIRFGWLGASSITFEILDRGGKWIEYHRMPIESDVPSIGNPVLPLRVLLDKSEGVKNVKLATASLNGGRVGEVNESSERFKSFNHIKENLVAGETSAVFSLKNKETYFNRQNLVTTLILFLSANVDGGGKFINVKIIRNANFIDTPDWQDVELDNSVMEYDTTATNIEGGESLISFGLSGSGEEIIDLSNFEIRARPDETLSFAIEPFTGADALLSTRWKELF